MINEFSARRMGAGSLADSNIQDANEVQSLTDTSRGLVAPFAWPFQSDFSKILCVAFLNVFRGYEFTNQELWQQLRSVSVDIDEDGWEMAIDGLGIERHLFARTDLLFETEFLRHCPSCLEGLYHTNIFQLKNFERCPIHGDRIENFVSKSGASRRPKALFRFLRFYLTLYRGKDFRLWRRQTYCAMLQLDASFKKKVSASWMGNLNSLKEYIFEPIFESCYSDVTPVTWNTLLVGRDTAFQDHAGPENSRSLARKVWYSLIPANPDHPTNSTLRGTERTKKREKVFGEAFSEVSVSLRAQLAEFDSFSAFNFEFASAIAISRFSDDKYSVEPYSGAYACLLSYCFIPYRKTLGTSLRQLLIKVEDILRDETLVRRVYKILIVNLYWSMYQWLRYRKSDNASARTRDAFISEEWLMMWIVRGAVGRVRLLIGTPQYVLRGDDAARCFRSAAAIRRRAERLQAVTIEPISPAKRILSST